MPEVFSLAGKRIWVAGHLGMVGSAVVRRFARENVEVITADRARLDLMRQAAVEQWLAEVRPDAIVVAASKVGGILANESFPADFLYENLAIETNIISSAHRADVNRLLFLGSSCIYPRDAPQPILETALLTGPLESTNEGYALAKIAGIKLCQAFRRQYGRDYVSAMPTNLYGPRDNFDLQSSHVIPALLRKAHEAKRAAASELVIWGTGAPRREFLHVDDCADALTLILGGYSEDEHINVGSGADMTILALAHTIAEVVGFGGRIVADPSKPDGTPQKLMSGAKLAKLGWRPRISLEQGLLEVYRWFLETSDIQPKLAGGAGSAWRMT